MSGHSVFWFRRDLRLDDNVGLYKAVKSGRPVIPIFVFDPDILDELPQDDARVSFIHDQLSILQKNIREAGGQLLVFHGKVLDVYRELINTYDITSIYSNRDYEPYAIKRDKAVEQLANENDIAFYQFKDQVLFEQDQIVKADGNPYVVYTPYRKRWEALMDEQGINPLPSPEDFNWASGLEPSMPSLEEIGFERSKIEVPAFRLNTQLIEQYEEERNFPAKDQSTSRLGPHLRFGTVSVRKLADYCLKYQNRVFLHQLIWRDFFMQILWHFPHTTNSSFKPVYDRIHWRNNKEEFEQWCQGKTGYPLVDAGMRQLVATGYMHNRVRMVVASFLCKHLLIDWRWGEAFFAKHLLDFELAANVGNWQWAAGSGVDAAPYFRIFNPMTQFQKFDPTKEYVSTWVPEWQELTYVQPMVDHKMARERCLSTYKAGIQ